MKVKDLIPALSAAKTISLCWSSATVPLDLTDPVIMASFGDYKVHAIHAYGADEDTGLADTFEIELTVSPVKETEA